MDERIKQEMDWRMRVFDSLSFPTLILRPDRRIIAANRVFLEKFKVDVDEVLGKTCRDMFKEYYYDKEPPCQAHDCPLDNTLKYKRGYSILRKVINKKGMPRWEDRVFSPILDDDGEVRYIIESVRDVTRVKTLERMYSGIQELMDKVVYSSASAIVAADRKGNIVLANQATEALFGYSLGEASEVNIREVYHQGVARGIMKKLRDESLGGRGKLPTTKVTIITKSGEEIPTEMTAAIIYEDNEEVGTMGIFNDCREKLAVEKKLAEARAQLVQSEKLASLGRLAAGVAHEINNPLTSILLYGNMMLEKLEKDHPLAQNLEYVLEDADRCREIVKDLLAYSRQTSPSKEAFRVNALVEESLGLIRDQKMFMNITVVKDLARFPVFVNADKKQLCQVVINLIINAVDAMDGQGRLTCRTFRDREAGQAVLEVEDSGSGIPDAISGKVFDPFFTTKEPGKGTGLGLSMAYGIVKENHGHIFIKESRPGGTVFRLELPELMIQDGEPLGVIG